MRRASLIFVAVLIAATLGCYAGVWTHDFVNYDDGEYIYENPHVRDGVTASGVAWAFTSAHSSNWHPLTWISHMVDCQLFGLNAGAHHGMNVLLHAMVALALFVFLTRTTEAPWASAFVAAVFALHPLRVESVAWASERKDVLVGLFWMLTMLAYARYARDPSLRRMVVVAIALAASLMSKPMAVTLPFVLLLLDVWPLRRWRGTAPAVPGEPRDTRGGSSKRSGVKAEKAAANAKAHGTGASPRSLRDLFVEKVPLLGLVVVSVVVTLLVQSQAGSTRALDDLPFGVRVLNAVASYGAYLVKTVWPAGLAVFYPHPASTVAADGGAVGALLAPAIASAVVLLVVTVAAVRTIRTRPYLAVGWFWYVGTLVPVIGIVQVGNQAMADRYTYLPSIGLYVMVAWGVRDLVGSRAREGAAIAAVAVTAGVCASLTVAQVPHWRDSTTLFERALAVTDGNYLAHYNLGTALAKRGETDAALEHFEATIRLQPEHANAHVAAGAALLAKGRAEDAAARLERAIELDSSLVLAHLNLGMAQLSQGRAEDAATTFRRALELEERAEAHYGLGAALARSGRVDDARSALREALRMQPDYAPAQALLERLPAE